MKDLKNGRDHDRNPPRGALTADQVAKQADFFQLSAPHTYADTHGLFTRRLHEVPEGLRKGQGSSTRSVPCSIRKA